MQSLAAVPESVPMARRFVIDTLPDLPEETSAELALMVSELATNCVLHAKSEFQVKVSRTPREVRVEVSDTGTGNPQIQHPAATDTHGRGLHIVDQLSQQWGVIHAPARPGKTVWFTLAVL